MVVGLKFNLETMSGSVLGVGLAKYDLGLKWQFVEMMFELFSFSHA